MRDPGNGCLPWQPTSPTSATQALGWRTPGNKTLVCGSAGLAGCAAADPFGADPICAGVIDDIRMQPRRKQFVRCMDTHAEYANTAFGKIFGRRDVSFDITVSEIFYAPIAVGVRRSVRIIGIAPVLGKNANIRPALRDTELAQ